MCTCLYILRHLAVQLTCVCCLCDVWSEVSTLDCRCLCCLLRRCKSPLSAYAFRHGSVYFLRKNKMAAGRIVDFRCALLGCSVFVHIGPPRTFYDRRFRYMGSLVAIQQRVREEIANSRLQWILLTNKVCGNHVRNIPELVWRKPGGRWTVPRLDRVY